MKHPLIINLLNLGFCRFEDSVSTPSLRSPKFASAPPNLSFRGWWTFPYYSCSQRKWILSYSIAIAPVKHPEYVLFAICSLIFDDNPNCRFFCCCSFLPSLTTRCLFHADRLRGFLSIDIDVSELYINQCDMNNNQFYSENHYSNFRNNKFSHNQDHHHQQQQQQQQINPPLINSFTPLQPQSTFHLDNEIDAFHGSHKCHRDSMDVSDLAFCKHFNWIFPLSTWSLFSSASLFVQRHSNDSRFIEFQCQFRPQYLNNNRLSSINGWTRGSYQCLCKQGFYSIRHPDGFNGTIMEVAYEEYLTNKSSFYVDSFLCMPCMEGCISCTGPTPCLAMYNWPFR